jgi:hypothetical protein
MRRIPLSTNVAAEDVAAAAAAAAAVETDGQIPQQIRLPSLQLFGGSDRMRAFHASAGRRVMPLTYAIGTLDRCSLPTPVGDAKRPRPTA